MEKIKNIVVIVCALVVAGCAVALTQMYRYERDDSLIYDRLTRDLYQMQEDGWKTIIPGTFIKE